MKNKGLLAALAIMAVGFAAVTTNLVINGTSILKKNTDDFKVYYSNALVNGTQDLSVVESETKLSFTTTLDTLGETYVLEYDVTNWSKNYDAELEMVCTGGNDYLTVTNDFDTENNLEALQTRRGKLTLELIKSYTGDDLPVTIECTINANAVERNALGEGSAASPVEAMCEWVYEDLDNSGTVTIGDLYTCGTESFNIVGETSETITMLASNVLGKDYRQTTSTETSEYQVGFSNSNMWIFSPGPQEIDIQEWNGNANIYVNSYVSYLQAKTGDTSITGNLITLAELKALGCTGISDNYSSSGRETCANSKYASWLVNGQKMLTCSAGSDTYGRVWDMYASGMLHTTTSSAPSGIRPVITISKNDLNNL